MSRRMVLIGAVVAGLCLAALIAWPMSRSLDALRGSRTALATANAQAAAPHRRTALVVPPAAIPAADVNAAASALVKNIRQAAQSGGVLVEQLEPALASPGVAAVSLRVSGNEKAVLALAQSIETTRPAVRLAQWQVSAITDGTVRLQAKAVAPWRR